MVNNVGFCVENQFERVASNDALELCLTNSCTSQGMFIDFDDEDLLDDVFVLDSTEEVPKKEAKIKEIKTTEQGKHIGHRRGCSHGRTVGQDGEEHAAAHGCGCSHGSPMGFSDSFPIVSEILPVSPKRKPLPEHLQYAFLGVNETYPVQHDQHMEVQKELQQTLYDSVSSTDFFPVGDIVVQPYPVYYYCIGIYFFKAVETPQEC